MFLESFVIAYPLGSILLFSAAIASLLTILYKATTDQEKLKELKGRMKEIQGRMKEERENKEKIMELQKEMFKISGEQMKASMKSMLITFLPIIVIFIWLKALYSAAGVGDIIYWGSNLPIIHTGAGWFLSYIIFGTFFSILFRKLFKVH